MLDVSPQLVETLEDILPTYPEMFLETTTVPCISYFLYNDTQDETGDTLQYSSISYVIKVWGRTMKEIHLNSQYIDWSLNKIGYRRVSSGLQQSNGLICNTMIYRGKGKEFYDEI